MGSSKRWLFLSFICLSLVIIIPKTVQATLLLGSEELVQANETNLQVPGYSVPSCTDWNNDGLVDLIVGQGGDGISPAKVAIFLNSGTNSSPIFSSSFHAQSEGSDLNIPASGCLGLFPRVVYWDSDSRKDLLIGTAVGYILIYLNTGTDDNPVFDAGTMLVVDAPHPIVINVGSRATPCFLDWDEDGLRDLISGAADGQIHIFLNTGTNTEPLFAADTPVMENSEILTVPGSRSSPAIYDFNDDGKKDILTGNTNGQLLFYPNIGTNSAPIFSGNVPLESDGAPIDFPGSARSRPSVCDWTGDGLPDILVGAGDGFVHLYQSQEMTPTLATPPISVSLGSPWPNPFNPLVNIEFNLHNSASIQLDVYDLVGRRVALLAHGEFPAGFSRVIWNGTGTQQNALPSGIYFVRLKSGQTDLRKKIVLVR